MAAANINSDSLPCIFCEKNFKHITLYEKPRTIQQLAECGGLDLNFTPSRAIHCSTYGNWGSTVLDEDNEKLHFIICDKCVKERVHLMIYEQRGGDIINAAKILLDDKAY